MNLAVNNYDSIIPYSVMNYGFRIEFEIAILDKESINSWVKEPKTEYGHVDSL